MKLAPLGGRFLPHQCPDRNKSGFHDGHVWRPIIQCLRKKQIIFQTASLQSFFRGKKQKSFFGDFFFFFKHGLFVVWVSPKKPVASRHKPKSRRANSPGSTPFGRSTGPCLLEKEKILQGSYFINFCTWKSQMTQMACHNFGIETDALDIQVLVHSML